MTAAERDLVAAIRAELAAIDPARPCDRAAERAGLATTTAARDPALARLWFRLGREVAGETSRIGPSREAIEAFDWPGRPEHCRLAWLRGIFLARGSLSLAGGAVHLEFLVAPDAAPVLADRLAVLGLPGSVRVRRGRGVVTWKGGETVDTFLRRVGASATLLELEAVQVARSLRGEINRVINAESANLERTVGAASRQLAAIRALEADGRLTDERAVVRRVAAARLATPEASIGELAAELGLHRSTVQRALERLERQAFEEPAAGSERRTGRRRRRSADEPPSARSGHPRRPTPAPAGRGRSPLA